MYIGSDTGSKYHSYRREGAESLTGGEDGAGSQEKLNLAWPQSKGRPWQ